MVMDCGPGLVVLPHGTAECKNGYKPLRRVRVVLRRVTGVVN